MGNPILRSGAAAVVASSSGTSLTATHPSGALPGDLLLIWNTSPDTGITWSVPGFNAVSPASGSGMSVQLLWKIDSGTEPGTYTVTSSGTTNAGLIICAYGNVDQIVLFDPSGYSGQINATQNAVTASPITTLYPNSQFLWFGSVVEPSGAVAITLPGGYASRVAQSDGSAGGTNVGVLMADRHSPGPGQTPTVSGTLPAGQSQFNAALLLGLAVANPIDLTPIRHGTINRRKFAPYIRRGRAFHPPLPAPQANPAIAGFLGRTSVRSWGTQFTRIISRGRVFNGPIPQGLQGQAFPVFTGRTIRQRPGVPFIRRGRFFGAQELGQSNQGVVFPLWTRRPDIKRPGAPFIRRGRAFLPGWGQTPQGSPWMGMPRRRAADRTNLASYRLIARGRISVPLPPQRGQGVRFPLWTRQSGRSPKWYAPYRVTRGRTFQYLIPKITWQAQATFSATGTLTYTVLVTKVASASFSATGTMTVTAVRTVLGSASLSGTGALAARALVTEVASATLSGTGTLTASAAITKIASATLSGTGTLTAAAVTTQATRMSGTGTLTVTPVLTQMATAALSGTGSLTVTVLTAAPVQRITITPNARAAWETIKEGRLMDIRSPHVAESYVTTQDLEDGTFDP